MGGRGRDPRGTRMEVGPQLRGPVNHLRKAVPGERRAHADPAARVGAWEDDSRKRRNGFSVVQPETDRAGVPPAVPTRARAGA